MEIRSGRDLRPPDLPLTVRAFIDTNVLVYADDASVPDKKRRAVELLNALFDEREGVVSLQVLREYFVAATRKLKLPSDLAAEKTQAFAEFELVVESRDDLYAAIDLHRLRGYSLWDCLILRAAIRSGCKRLYSEDLQHGQYVEGIQIVNPFHDLPPAGDAPTRSDIP